MLEGVYTYFCLVQATPSTSAITCTRVFTRRRDLMQHTTKKHRSCELIASGASHLSVSSDTLLISVVIPNVSIPPFIKPSTNSSTKFAKNHHLQPAARPSPIIYYHQDLHIIIPCPSSHRFSVKSVDIYESCIIFLAS